MQSANPMPDASVSGRVTACDACYKRKIKCDSVRPRCNWCLHHEMDCTYMRQRYNRAGQNRSRRMGLIDRIRRIDERIKDAPVQWSQPNEQPQSAMQEPSSSLTASSSRILHFAGWKIGNIGPQIGVPSLLPEGLGWIQSKTGKMIPFPSLCHAPWEKPSFSSSSTRLNEDYVTSLSYLELPTRAVIKKYLDVYGSSTIQTIFPVINLSLFSSTIDAAHTPAGRQRPNHHSSAKACIFALLALIATMDPHGTCCTAPQPPPIPRVDYITKAKSLLPYMIEDNLSLEAIQAALTLAILETLMGDFQTSLHYNSIASRFIISLEAHTMGDPSEPANPSTSDSRDYTTKKHLRNLFWICYALDKDVSLRTGGSHCLRDEDCNLQLPRDYIEQLYSRMSYSHSTENINGPLFPIDLRLSMIKSQISKNLYSYRGLQNNDAEVIRLIRELDEQLEDWRMSMPPKLRPKLSFTKPPHDAQHETNMYLVLTHMNYYFCVNLIHLAGSRCEAWRSASAQPIMMDGLRSSLTISVEASRSLLVFLQNSESQVTTGSFWTVLFYPMSAMLTIFCNLLEHPRAEGARDDIKLLAITEHTAERVFLRQISRNDKAAHLESIIGFTSNLRNIAQQAVNKAENEPENI